MTVNPAQRPLWIDTTPATTYPPAVSCTVDVVVVGGGIAGISAAYLLKRAGLRVAVLDRGRVCEGNTALTTAHLTWMLDQPIHRLRRNFGAEAVTVLEAHAAAIDEVERIVVMERIACDFDRVAAWRCGLTPDKRQELERDAADARALGRECDYVTADAAPVHAPGGALRLPRQARFHPRKYVLALAAAIDGDGSFVFEGNAVTEAVREPTGWRVRAGDASVTGTDLVVATHSPFGVVPSLQTRLEAFQTYVLGARVPKGSFPDALLWDCAEPYHYTRLVPGDEYDTVVLGGADHKTGELDDTLKPHRALERYLRETLGVADYVLTHEWSGQVLGAADGVAYIGRHPGDGDSRWVATGFGGNGMTYGTITGILLRDLILGVENPWAHVFDPGRTKVLASAAQVVRANTDAAYQYVAGRMAPATLASIEDVPAGEGRMVQVAGRKLAVYRDAHNVVTAVSPVCPHLGCIVGWNAKEKTWDCPCHGSRFAATGEVTTGPATRGLEPVEIAAPEGVAVFA